MLQWQYDTTIRKGGKEKWRENYFFKFVHHYKKIIVPYGYLAKFSLQYYSLQYRISLINFFNLTALSFAVDKHGNIK